MAHVKGQTALLLETVTMAGSRPTMLKPDYLLVVFVKSLCHARKGQCRDQQAGSQLLVQSQAKQLQHTWWVGMNVTGLGLKILLTNSLGCNTGAEKHKQEHTNKLVCHSVRQD
jgi:hypothetical protein